MAENWRPVVGYEGLYEVSDQGQVRSLDRVVVFKNGGQRFYAGVVLKHGYSKGYPRVNLYKKTIPRCELIHQLVLAAFVGPMCDGHEVRHYDGDRKNPTLGNLLYGTRSENYDDKIRHGRDNRGGKSHLARLSEDQVLAIRRMCASGAYTQAEIADLFGVNQSHVSDIKNGYRWGHLQ